MTPVDTGGPRPAPLTPAGCDLQNFLRMPLVVGRLLSSETWVEASADPRLGHVLMSLWAEAWRQVPAGSLPANDMTLQRMSMCPSMKEWARVRERAMRDWVLCTDGRYYHRVVAEMALECWLEKLDMRRRSAKGNAEKHKIPVDTRAIEAEIAETMEMLRRANPHSQALVKRRKSGRAADAPVAAAPVGPPGGGSGGGPAGGDGSSHRGRMGSVGVVPVGAVSAPTGSAEGALERSLCAPTGSAEGVLVGSQGNGRDISPKPPDPGCGQLSGAPPAGMPTHVRLALGALAQGVAGRSAGPPVAAGVDPALELRH